jgi:FkbM family methyltransferase
MSDFGREIELFLNQLNGEKIKSSYDAVFNNNEIKHICLYGAGNIGRGYSRAYRSLGIKVDFFCDSSPLKIGKSIDGVPCISIDELKKIKDDTFVVITTGFANEIIPILEANGLSRYNCINNFQMNNYNLFNDSSFRNEARENIIKLLGLLADEQSKKVLHTLLIELLTFQYDYKKMKEIKTDDQYFADGIVFLNDESFVDAGSYDGDTLREFINRANGKFRDIHAIEMNHYNFKKLKNFVSTLDCREKIHCHNAALYDNDGIIRYDINGTSSAINGETTGAEILNGHSVRLDKLLEKQRVTFIKMDIEGAEVHALRGSEGIIREQRPKCAICVYHDLRHLWEVPLLLHEYCPSYKFYLRHHSMSFYETVCYAIP